MIEDNNRGKSLTLSQDIMILSMKEKQTNARVHFKGTTKNGAQNLRDKIKKK